MTKTQENVIDRITDAASRYWPIKGVTTRDFRKEGWTLRAVSVAIDFGWDCPCVRGRVHLFIGPRGAIYYPVQTGPEQINRRFNWDFAQVMRDQEAGWVAFRKYRGWE